MNPFQAAFAAGATGPGGIRLTLPGFYDGNSSWKVRFAPTAEGEWSLLCPEGMPFSISLQPRDSITLSSMPTPRTLSGAWARQATMIMGRRQCSPGRGLQAEWYHPLTGKRQKSGVLATGTAQPQPPAASSAGPVALHVGSSNR